MWGNGIRDDTTMPHRQRNGGAGDILAGKRRSCANILLALIRLHMWLRRELNLQAKSLMLLRPIPEPKRKPDNLLRLLGFFTNLVAGRRNHRDRHSLLVAI
jgi:hypothetical protein